MKKKLSALVACLTLVVLASSSAMGGMHCLKPGLEVASGPQDGQSFIDAAINASFPFLTDSEIYKSDVSGGSGVGSDTGHAAAWYTTKFSNTATDPSDATITHNGGLDIIDATHLLVKGGGGPSGLANWYLFDISSWNGTDTICLKDFWPKQGSISHVTIYGASSVVPEPTSIGLFVLGMGCVTGGSFIRRRRV